MPTLPPTPAQDADALVAAVTPSIADVAILERTRTVGASSGGLGGDTGPADVTLFTELTRPKGSEVAALIAQSVPAVLVQLPRDIPELIRPQVKHAVALYAAILVETSFFREQLDEGSVELYRSLLGSQIAALQVAAGGTGASAREVDSIVIRSAMADQPYEPPLYPPVQLP